MSGASIAVGVIAAGTSVYAANKQSQAAAEQRRNAAKLSREMKRHVKEQMSLGADVKQQYDQNYLPMEADYVRMAQDLGNAGEYNYNAAKAQSAAMKSLGETSQLTVDPSQGIAQQQLFDGAQTASNAAGLAAAGTDLQTRQNYIENLSGATALGQGVAGAASNAAGSLSQNALSSATSNAKIKNALTANIGDVYGEIGQTASGLAGNLIGKQAKPALKSWLED